MRRLKEGNTCACKYHVEMAKLRQGFNNMRTVTKGIHDKRHYKCCYDVCLSSIAPGHYSTNSCQFFGVTNMWMSILYPMIEDSQWHNSKCLVGHCIECKVDMLITCPKEESLMCSKLMQWKCYELVIHGKMHVGVDNKVL
jgi:hypothetical protein